MWPDWAIFCSLCNFSKPLATINLPKSLTFLSNFSKGIKIYHFSCEIIFVQLLQTFGDFYLVTLAQTNGGNVIWWVFYAQGWVNFFIKWAIFGLFFFIFVFSIQLTLNVQYRFLPIHGFVLQTSGIRRDRFTNWATTTAIWLVDFSLPVILFC